MILSTLDKSRKGGAYEQIPSLVLGQRWTPQLNSRNMMKVVLCVWIEPYIENDLSFCVWPVHTPTTSKEVLTLSASTSPLPYTGNKSCIVNTILSVMPKHTVYIDPCMGSAEVFFRKPRAEKEILNDYNGDLVNLFRVIQNNEKLAYLLGRLYLSINGELAFKQNKDNLFDFEKQDFSARCNLNVIFSRCIQMEKERNLNYWTIRKFSLLYSYYAIIDTTDYLADQLFVKNEVRVWFGQEYICPDGPYCVIFCKCRKRDTGAFESAMNELPRKMLLRGHTDYIQFCEGLKNKIAAAWKSGGELQHEEARPSA